MNMIERLLADGPNPELKDKLMLFAPLVGDWDFEWERYYPNGRISKRVGETHFHWILNGTALQEVWFARIEMPLLGLVTPFFATSIRFYDQTQDLWRVIWIDPARSVTQSFVARAVGDEIIVDGKTPDGQRSERWIISGIRPETFQWHAFESQDGEESWQLIHKVTTRRMDS